MISDKAPILDWNSSFDDGNYKSCFARSVAVNSQHSTNKSFSESQSRQEMPEERDGLQGASFQKTTLIRPLLPATESDAIKLRKNPRSLLDDQSRRLSCSSIGSRRTSICSSSRLAELPVENIVQKSKVETLQWQMKEVEKSREMYKAVMKEVVTFLERAHRNLELLGTRLNTRQNVPRTKSEHHISDNTNDMFSFENTDNYTLFRDFTLRRPKKQDTPSDEVPPEKLSQEAFRLLRTVQSLLNTQEPKLTTDDQPDHDEYEFLAQLAKEFPRTPETKHQRTTSFSSSPKLLTPDQETKISTAFNRKLSLQLNDTRKYSARTHDNFLSSTDNPMGFPGDKLKKKEPEKSTSPSGGSISSVEDESGFSSMNSFQDVGLPLIGDEVSTKNALLRSMIHNNGDTVNPEDVKIWQKSSESPNRWSSTPLHSPTNNKKPMNVLWV